MISFSFGWSEELGEAIKTAMKESAHDGTELYEMSLTGDDTQSVYNATNQGIDAHLEACFIPDRGDDYWWFEGRLKCEVSAESLPVLVRRLLESENEAAKSLGSSICETLEIELI